MSTKIDNKARELGPKLQRYAKFQIIIAVAALVITIATAISIYPLIQTRAKLQGDIDQLQKQREQEIQHKNQEIEELRNRIREIRGLADSLASIKGKRKFAVDLALDLQERNFKFVMGGRKPEDGGFDLSGFIDYILSRPEIGIVKNPANCNQSCLMNDVGIIKSSALSELRPGDLIFYEGERTMMYLGKDKCIGMLYQGKIETEDVHFMRIIGYGKVTYGD